MNKNPLEIDKNEMYECLKESFINTLYSLQESGVIDSLIISDEFKGNKDLKELSVLPYETRESEDFAMSMPYCEVFECKNVPLVSCRLKGVEDFNISLGAAITVKSYHNATSALGLTVCCKYGEHLFKKQYASCFEARCWSDSSKFEAFRDALIDFTNLLNRVRKLEVN